MSSPKGQELGLSTPTESRRLRLEPKTYTRRRNDKNRFKRHSSDDVPGPSRSGKSKEKYVGPPSVILDNGSYMAKIGLSNDEKPSVIPNCMMKVKSERKRLFVSNQIEECRDLSGLYYLMPCEKGYIMKWTVQKPVWDYMFNNICPIEDRPVIMTQPLFNFKAIQEITDEIFFEEYEIKSMLRANPTDFAKYEYTNGVVGRSTSCLIVDSGFSCTTIVPYIDGEKYYKGIRKINVGGKLLTNYLKDIISYRQLHVMDETYVINQVKEDTCYVSMDFKHDMRIASSSGDRNTIVKNYVLPDFNAIRRGYVQQQDDNSEIAEGCQILRLNNERFTVPELLFYPSDIGMESTGIAETIVKSIKLCPLNYQPQLAKNIVVIGGNANFSNFKERVYADVRSYLPDHWTVNVYKPENPTTFSWKGGKSLSEDPKMKSLSITKEEYEERGSSYTYEKFSDWVGAEKVEAQDKSKSSEVKPTSESILRSSNFTRFDLFGKHEPEREEDSAADEKGTDADRVIVKDGTSGNNKNNENAIDIDSTRDSKEDDAEVGNSGGDLDQEETEHGNNKSERNSKNKANGNMQDLNADTYKSFDSYDFNVFENSYI